jgi:translation initiation factor 5A
MSANYISDVDDNDFTEAGTVTLESTPIACSGLKKKDFVLVNKRPAKIVELEVSKVGKHGHAKTHFVAIDIFNDKKYEQCFPGSHNIRIPIVTKKEYKV